jgi:hypothetical protein
MSRPWVAGDSMTKEELAAVSGSLLPIPADRSGKVGAISLLRFKECIAEYMSLDFAQGRRSLEPRFT